ncbi:MAG: tetratricopeptide repeat protein, partial [Verrucomicrobia bacterium]|nr:tetratricopeptide repeat protein [Verrucomicrobiota bacterium]
MSSRLRSLREALALSPDNVPLLLLYAQAALDEKDLTAAREGFERVLQAQPGHPVSCLGIAKVLFFTGNISEAIIRTETLIQTQPRFGDAWLLLARLALAEGEIATAREHYQKMVQLDSTLRDPLVEEQLQIEAELPLNHSSADTSNTRYEPVGEVEDDRPMELEHPKVSFRDVGGMNDVKE